MNKEALLALDLTEEQVNKVIDGFGHMVPKSRLDEKISQVKALTEQNADYNTQLEELKKVDAAALQGKIEELQAANTLAQTEFEKQIAETQLRSEVSRQLLGKVHDEDMVFGLLNREAVTMENGKITGGLEDQLTALKESKAFLFVPETAPPAAKSKITGAQPHVTGGAGGTDPVSEGSRFAQTANSAVPTGSKDPWA